MIRIILIYTACDDVRSNKRQEVKIPISGIDLSPKLVGAMFPQAFPPSADGMRGLGALYSPGGCGKEIHLAIYSSPLFTVG
jgi:hypothetical protein